MASAPVPEIEALKALIHGLQRQQPNAHVLNVMESLWPSPDGHHLVDLMVVVDSLKRLAADLPTGPTQDMGVRTALAVQRLFTSDRLARNVGEFRAVAKSDLDIIEHSLGIFDHARSDVDGFKSNVEKLNVELDKLSVHFNKSDLSDASKSVLMAQIRLLKNSIERFDAGSVLPFRDSAYSVIGRVVIEIQKDTKASPADKRKLIDEAMRLYGILEAAGNILSLVAPVISGYLDAPSTDMPEAPSSNGLDAG